MRPWIRQDIRWGRLLLGAGLLASGAAVLALGMGLNKQGTGAPVSATEPLTDRAAVAVRLPRASSRDQHSARAAPGGFDRCWQAWAAGSRMTTSGWETESALEELAVDDPHRAMALALGENDSELRARLRSSVLRGWASTFPAEAADWVMAQSEAEHHSEMEAVFDGATRRPEEAVTLGLRLCAQDPTLAGDYGQLLITALAKAGAHETAVQFATAAASENLPAWMNVAFYQWASEEPEQALRSFDGISDPLQRLAAYQGIVAGWSETNPAAAATFAMKYPPSLDSGEALGQVLSQWVNRDPAAASEWLMSQAEPHSSLDEGAVLVATLPSLISKKPEIAMAWAEAITDPSLRASTLQAVAREWALRDPGEIRRFIVSTPSLLTEEYLALSKGLEGSLDPGGTN